MRANSPQIQLSAIDEQRWGVRTAKVTVTSPDEIGPITDFCQENQVVFLIARCAVTDLPAAQAMERRGFGLMDTLLYFSRRLDIPVPDMPDGISVRVVRDEEPEAVRMLARRAFRGYQGHYHADDRLDRVQCDAVYESWAYNSCVSRALADEVLVAVTNGIIGGFVTLRLANPEDGEGPLYGVAPELQGHQLGRVLMIGGLHWCRSKGARRMIMSTQITNLSSQKVWLRLGFEPLRAEYTFHRWFD